MAEFIGSRISLISKRDIRYVGTLHEISSENSTVALEQVISFGTEGRRPDDEVAPSDNIYEYIVFRGSDVKDLRIEDTPKENKPPPPQVPDDPAILGSARASTALSAPQPIGSQQRQPHETLSKPAQQAQQPQQPSQSQQPLQSQPIQQSRQPLQNQQTQTISQNHQPPRFQQHPYPYYFPPPPNARFGPQGFPPPPGPGFPGMPYGAPPGWYPPPGQGFHHPPPSQYYAPQPPIGSVPQQHVQGPPGPPGPAPQPSTSTMNVASKEEDIDKEESVKTRQDTPEKPVATVKLPSASTTPTPLTVAESGPSPPIESKPNIVAALAPPVASANKETPTVAKAVPAAPKNGRIMPAIPRLSPAIQPHLPINGAPKPTPGPGASEQAKLPAKSESTHSSPAATTKTIDDATRDARAAVAAAMAKLPPAPESKEANGASAVDNLATKVNEMDTNDNIRTLRHPGTGGYSAGHRGGRGSYRGGRSQAEQQVKKVEVPETDYDFASANAKFNKQDLVKEAIATGSPFGSFVDAKNPSAENPVNGADRPGSESSSVVVPPAVASYNKTSSFFDNISSESKDRDDAGGKKLGGREFRTEEQKKNLETFGQGSVDNGYRGGYRGRGGRARGYGRARGGGFGGRGGRGVTRGGASVAGAVGTST